jgi:THO complex subunit 4
VKKNANTGKGSATAGKGTKKTARGGRSSRPAKKTAEELDSEMADYFVGGNTDNTANTAAPAAAAGGDAAMEEDVL